MAKQLFANNASALLAASISDSDLTIQVAAGFGTLYPSPGANEYMLITLENDDGDIEVVKCTSRSTDLLTVAVAGRGQEGTSAQSWTNGLTRVELRMTKGTMENLVQRDGDEMTGDLNMNENEIQDAILTGAASKIDNIGEIVSTPLRGATGDASNELAVPSDGSRATAGGLALLTAGDVEEITEAAFVVGQVIMWYGTIGNIPDGWALCNGSNGTPDLRNRFVVGAGDTYALDATGGAVTDTTSSDGSHDHDVTVGSHALTVEELPEHSHRILYQANSNYSASGSSQFRTMQVTNNVQYQTNNETTGTPVIEATGEGAAHSHEAGATSNDGAHTHTVDTLPPYKALYYIMFVGF
jgi:microcystin-dependent protein